MTNTLNNAWKNDFTVQLSLYESKTKLCDPLQGQQYGDVIGLNNWF